MNMCSNWPCFRVILGSTFATLYREVLLFRNKMSFLLDLRWFRWKASRNRPTLMMPHVPSNGFKIVSFDFVVGKIVTSVFPVRVRGQCYECVHFNLEIGGIYLMYSLVECISVNFYIPTDTLTDIYRIRKYFRDYMNVYGKLGCGWLMTARSFNCWERILNHNEENNELVL